MVVTPVELQGVYLFRLQRLLRLRQRHEHELNGQGLRLLDRSIFASYCDCLEVGVGHRARALLRDLDFAVEQPAAGG